ncbi:MAG: nuclear transport factor 2 family protein [Myxococcota bacterium]|nr:nuclear transport factor 2 family protein [Myxococcota bacterium]
MTADSMADRFIAALTRAEQEHAPDALVALFRDDAELRSFIHDEPMHGVEGARRFWSEYLFAFRQLRSRFEKVTNLDGLAILEWVTEGTLSSGSPITYRGVSLVEHDGTAVRSFRTYYDSAALGARTRTPSSEGPAPRH